MSNAQENIDATELAKFESVASRWWDPDSEFGPLHKINPLRLDWIRQHADLNGQAVLDIGCGGGILAEAMALCGAHVTGIDMAEGSLAVARLHLHESGAEVDYRKVTAEALAEEQPGQYDVVTCLEMLEHVPDPAAVVAASARLVRPGGHVYFSTINRNPKAFMFAIVGAEYLLRLLPAGTHDYEKFIKPSELEHWSRHAGLVHKDSTGMHYNPLTREYSLGPDISVNYLMYYQRPDTA